MAIKMYNFDAKDRVQSHRIVHQAALSGAGYANLPQKKLHIAVKHIMRLLKPPY